MKKFLYLFLCLFLGLTLTLTCHAKVVNVNNNTSSGNALPVNFGDTIVINSGVPNDGYFYTVSVPYNGTVKCKVTVDKIVGGVSYVSKSTFEITFNRDRRYLSMSDNQTHNAEFSAAPGTYYFIINSTWGYLGSNVNFNYKVEFDFQCSHIEAYEATTKKASCSEEGIIETKCRECQETLETQPIEKLPHTPNSEWTHIKDESCSEEGKKELYCSVCNAVVEEKILEKLPHTYGEWSVKTETSCKEAGEEVRVCSVCSYVDSREIEALPHSYGDFTVTRETSCSKEGEKERTCLACGYRDIQEIDKISHDFEKWVTDADATCTDEGERHRECKKCQYKETEELEKISHDYGSWSNTTEPSCLRNGERVRRCKSCNYEETQKVPATGHEYGEWDITKEATERSSGTRRRDCENCSNYETETIARLICGEEYTWKVTKEATCEEKGVKTKYCDYCNKVLDTDDIAKKGHTITKWHISEKATRTSSGTKTANCDICRDFVSMSYTWELPGKDGFVSKVVYPNHFKDVKTSDWFYSYVKTSYEYQLVNGMTATDFKPKEKFTVAQALTVAMKIHSAYNDLEIPSIGSGSEWYKPYVDYCIDNGIITKNQFSDYNKNVTRGEMAIIFAKTLPSSAYTSLRSGVPTDMKITMPSYNAVKQLYKAGIIGGYEDGSYKPDNEISRSEASAIFTRIVVDSLRTK